MGTNSGNNYDLSVNTNNTPNDTTFRVNNSFNIDFDREGVLQFDLSSIGGNVDSAKLRLYLNFWSVGGGIDTSSVIDVFHASTDSWAEGTVTGNDISATGNVVASTTVTNQTGQYFEWDVSSLVSQELQGDGVVSFILRSPDPATDHLFEFFSKDDATSTNQWPELVVYQGESDTSDVSICQGDSILLGGAYQTSAGMYADTFQAANGCDSIVTTTLTVLSTSSSSTTASVCQGDSILLGGAYQTTAGMYVDTLQSANGCDSIVTTTLTISPLPVVSLGALQDDDTICDGMTAMIPLPSGAPAGGIYTGEGVNGNMFDPSSVSPDTYFITYTYTDSNNCANSDSVAITVEVCTGIGVNESELGAVNIFPNPAHDALAIKFGQAIEIERIQLLNTLGELIQDIKIPDNTHKTMLNVADLDPGIYFIMLPFDGRAAVTHKLVKH